MKNKQREMNCPIRHLASFALLVLFGLSSSAQEMTNIVPDGFAVVNFSDIVEFDRLHPSHKRKPRVADGPWEDGVKWQWKSKADLPLEQPNLNGPITVDPFGKMNPHETEIEGQVQRLASPSPISTFNGCDDIGTSIPPDVNGAAGPGHLMVTLNTQIRITDRSGSQVSIVSLEAFWSSLSTTMNVFDPRVLYDPFFRRWITVAVADARTSSSSYLIGVSRTSDPTGQWYLYRYDYHTANTNWVDYPSLGYNNKWVCIGANIFTNSTSAFVRSELFVFNKANLYAGLATPAQTRFTSLTGSGLSPAVTHDNSTTTPLYLVNRISGNSGGNGIIRLHKVDGNVGTPAYTALSQITTPNPWANTASGGAGFGFAPQLGSTDLIDNGDDRIQKVVYRNGSIWCTQNVFLPATTPTRTAVQWWQVTTTGTITQRGRIENTSGIFYAYPSIDVNESNDALIGFSRFSPTSYASAAYAIRYGTDAVNTMQTPFVFKSGLAPYFKTFGGSRNRWGDYSAVCLDPNNPRNFFTLQEYAASPVNGTDRWGTWWANVAGKNPRTSSYVVTDVTANRAFYYDASFNLITSNTLSSTSIGGTTNVSDVCTKPGGKGGPSDLILDATNKRVLRSTLTGTAAGASKTLLTNAGASLTSPTGIEILGDSLYVLDKGGKAIYRYSLASAFSGSGTINASQKITLASAISKAESMRIMGAGPTNLSPFIYILDDNTSKRIYKYTLAGTLSATSNILTGNPALSNVTGLTSYSVFNQATSTYDYYHGVIDRGTDRYYEFKGNQVFSSVVAPAAATIVRQLNSANLNCTGIDFSTNPGILREGEPETIEVANQLQLTAFPNPTSGLISLMMRGLEPVETRIMVYDLMGRQLSEKTFSPGEISVNELQLDLSANPPANYLIAVINGENRKTVIVQRH